jgi:outer membrane protein assembly factor BamB
VRRRPSRTRRILSTVSIAAAVVVLSAGTALAVNYFVADDPIIQQVFTAPPSTAPVATIPRLEDTIVETPSDTGVFGVAAYRGGNGRTGVTDGGFRTVLGKYWEIRLPGSIETDPVAFGNVFYLGTANPDHLLYLLLNSGTVLTASVQTGDRVRSTPAFEPSGGDPPYLVFGTDDGRVYAMHSSQNQSYWDPPKSVGGVVSASPLLFGSIAVVVTEDGTVRALSIEDIGTGLGVGGGEEEIIEWTYTGTEAIPLGAVRSSPASDGTNIYVMDEEGWIHVVDLVTGTATCEPILGNGSLGRGANPVVSGDLVYFPTADGYLDRLEVGSCVLEDLLFVGPSSFNFPVVIIEEVLYAVEGPWLVAFEVPEGALNAAGLWTFTAEGQDPISTPPVYADGVLYIGTRGGIVYAVNATDGTELWRFDVGATIVGTPAVLANAVIVTTDNTVIAIAGE